MRTKLLCTTMGVLVSGAFAVGNTAMAADLGMRAPPPPPPMMTSYNWSGLYIGGFGGITAWEPTLWAREFDPELDDNFNDKGLGTFGGLVGGDIGYNWQMGSLVYGIEADFAGVFGGRSTFDEGDGYSASAQTQAIGTIRGRAGLAFDRTLVYLTAGFAEIQVKNKGVGEIDGDYAAASGTDWVPALAIGGGVEYALTNNWSIKAEGLYLAAATSKWTYSAADDEKRIGFKSTPSQALLKLGINYKF